MTYEPRLDPRIARAPLPTKSAHQHRRSTMQRRRHPSSQERAVEFEQAEASGSAVVLTFGACMAMAAIGVGLYFLLSTFHGSSVAPDAPLLAAGQTQAVSATTPAAVAETKRSLPSWMQPGEEPASSGPGPTIPSPSRPSSAVAANSDPVALQSSKPEQPKPSASSQPDAPALVPAPAPVNRQVAVHSTPVEIVAYESVAVPRLRGLNLIDDKSDRILAPLEQNRSYDLSLFQVPKPAVEFITTSLQPGLHMHVVIDGRERLEDNAPFDLPFNAVVGQHTVEVTPCLLPGGDASKSHQRCSGHVGETQTYHFTIK